MRDKVDTVGVLQLLVWKNLVNSFPNVYNYSTAHLVVNMAEEVILASGHFLY